MAPADTSLWDNLYGTSTNAIIRHKENLTTCQRLIPGSEEFQFIPLVCLTKVILHDMASQGKHCVARTVDARHCGKDITWKDFIAATILINKLSPDPDVLARQVYQIAMLVVCKDSRNGHVRQVTRMVKRWLKQAERACGGAGRGLVDARLPGWKGSKKRKAEELDDTYSESKIARRS
ncbi:hypothetical protein LTR36_000030 [Oleoguttula mirabilis]|uniref:Uncharacterized protein n=1 Tax=Oleoguttula mirabilis TaxID=1507867 RepID=A0AAV9JXN4_9PEZI|nr:hypothetical protein LTR36_000030 [Oleoguttula mirabilis]